MQNKSAMNFRGILCLLTLFACFSVTSKAQIKSQEKSDLSALFFGDYYWFIYNHNADLVGNNGFWIRRIYLTYDHRISDAFSGRVRLEMSSAGDFLTNTALVPEVKDAYLKWENDRHQIVAGIAPTPTWDLIEEVWGYRSVVKSPLDLHDMGSSRGLGLAFKGEIDQAGRFKYHFMIANGNGSKTELNKGKKFMLSLSYHLNENLVIQAYGDYETQKENRYIYTAQGFIGYQSESIDLGALFAYQFTNNDLSVGDFDQNIVSVFTKFRLLERLKALLRVDHLFGANPFGEEIAYIPFSDQAASYFLVGGVDLQLHPDVHLMPNVVTVFYGEDNLGVRPDLDLIARMTLFFQL